MVTELAKLEKSFRLEMQFRPANVIFLTVSLDRRARRDPRKIVIFRMYSALRKPKAFSMNVIFFAM